MVLALANYLRFRTVALALVVSATLLFGRTQAQTTVPEKTEKNKTEKSKAEQPLELPEFVITGVESLDVPGGAKQTPKPVAKLTQQQVSRFNPLDKQSFTLLPASPISRTLLPQQGKNGFLQGEFGLYLTPSVEAGYRTVLGNFDLNATGGILHSGGYQRNTDFTNVHLDIASGYLAPEKFFFFGGSRTDTYLKIKNSNYKFFGADSTAFPESAPERSTLDIEAGVQTVGSFENWHYDMGASAESVLLGGVHTNTLVNAHLAVKTALGRGFLLGGKAGVQVQGAQNRPFANRYLLAPSILAEYSTSKFSFAAEIGAHIASAESQTPIRPSVSLKAVFSVNSLLTLELSGFTGIRANSFLRALGQNPYTASSPLAEYLFERVSYDIAASIRVHPSQYINCTIGAGVENRDFAMVYGIPLPNGEFTPNFLQTSIFRLIAEFDGRVSSQDHLTAFINARFGAAGLVNSSLLNLAVPYLSPLEASLQYRRQWLPQFHSIVEGIYVAERSPGAGKNLPAYFDFRLRAEYLITPSISVYACATNLLNQPIFVWQGYKERGIFIAAGFVMTF